MSKFKSSLINELQDRGFIYQSTDIDALDDILSKEKITAYVGFDCTARSFHVGNLMQIMLMRKLQQHGHKPIIVLGSATTKIGDPSDKQGLRKILTNDEIQENKNSLSKTFHKFLNFSKDIPNHAEIVDNLEWLGDMKYLDFLREYGVYFSINRMLTFDSVKSRLDRESQLTFLEFNYMLLQAYDFLELYRRYNCRLQFGGSEQWGNIVSGIELGRKVAGAELFGITTPLITNSSGAKMGKTANGAVWLNPEMLSSYDYWQFWRNTADADVLKFMKLYTEISVDEINTFNCVSGKDLNDLKKRLANEATALCHDFESAQKARKTSEDTFEKGINADDLPMYDISEDIPLYRVLVETSLASSNSEAKKLILGRGVKLNDVLVLDEKMALKAQGNQTIKLSVGKKKNILLNFTVAV
jgi:tyrosyl-tRNA synthetase